MTHKTLAEKLEDYFKTITDIEGWVGNEAITRAVMGIMETHFTVSQLDLEVGNVVIKSDNTTANTKITIGEAAVEHATKVVWTLDAKEEPLGELQLTFI